MFPQLGDLTIPLHDVVVDTSDGLVFTGESLYFHFGRYPWNLREPEANPQHCEHQRRVEKRLCNYKLGVEPTRWLNKPCILGISPFSHNYYHFMTEIVPACLAKPNLPLLVSPTLPQSYSEFLKGLGIVTEIVETSYLGVAELWIPSCVELDGDALEWMKQSIFKSCGSEYARQPNSTTSIRSYISRSKARYRHLLNEAELWPVFAKHGIEIHHFESLAISQQIQLAMTMEWCIAPQGAGLTNIIFMPPKAKVLELRPTVSSGQYCYEKLAKNLDLDYHWLLGQQSGKFRLEPALLEAWLKRWN